jgi:hypothetical protein
VQDVIRGVCSTAEMQHLQRGRGVMMLYFGAFVALIVLARFCRTRQEEDAVHGILAV